MFVEAEGLDGDVGVQLLQEPARRLVQQDGRGGPPTVQDVRQQDGLALGLVLLEAIGAGVPVVSAAAMGPTEMRDLLGDRPDILSLFPVGDADGLALALKERATTFDATPGLAEMQAYIERYSIEATADDWIELAAEHGCAV